MQVVRKLEIRKNDGSGNCIHSGDADGDDEPSMQCFSTVASSSVSKKKKLILYVLYAHYIYEFLDFVKNQIYV